MSNPKSPGHREAHAKALSRRDTLKIASAMGTLGLAVGSAEDARADAEPVKLEPLKLTRASVGKISVRLFRQSSSASSASSELLESVDLSGLTRGQPKGRYSLKVYNVRGDREQLLAEHVLDIAEPTPTRAPKE